MRRRAGEDARDDVEALAPAGERHARLVAVLWRQPAHGRRAYVRRIGEDEVVALFKLRVQVRPYQAHARLVRAHVTCGNFERSRRNVARVHLRLGKCARGEDREAARAGAQIQDAARLALQLAKEKSDVRARDDDAPVHIKRDAVEPGFLQ